MALFYIWVYFQVKVLIPLLSFLQFAIILISTSLVQNNIYPQQANVYDGQDFDFIIVGGGTAGCVLANRLTEVNHWTVLLVEAGDNPPYVAESPGILSLISPKLPDWNFYTVNDSYSSQTQKTGNIHLSRGKILGGSSIKNFMFYVRGNKADYDKWASLGNEGWEWNSVLKHFKKSENLEDKDILSSNSANLHNTDGYVGVSRPNWQDETEEYLAAFKENGHEILTDINGHQQLGYGVPLFTYVHNQRQSTAFSFVSVAKSRPNLFVLKNTIAEKIIINNKKATGVQIKQSNGIVTRVKSNKEVILSAGTIMSPQVLMLSGIGPEKHLRDKGIKTIVDSPNVGKNLQDHPIVPVILTNTKDLGSIFNNFKPFLKMDEFISPVIMGHVSLNISQTFPDYQATTLPQPTGSILPALMSSLTFGWDDDICLAIAGSTSQKILYSLLTLLHPKSRGQITLQSNKIHDHPIINNGYFSNKEDINKFAEIVENFITIINTTYFKSVTSKVVDLNINKCKDFTFASHEYWKCYVLNLATSQFHPVGTCAMGPNEKDVVDEFLKVRSVKRLRVVDASIMPEIVSGNTNAAVIMIAEKAADMIKVDHFETC